MENKTLRRILKKSLGVSSGQELVTILELFEKGLEDSALRDQHRKLREDLTECLDAVDKAFADADRVLEMRDNALVVNTRELTSLNTEIAERARKQRAVLEQLQAMLRMMNSNHLEGEAAEAAVRAEASDDLPKLLTTVETLVLSHMNSERALRIMFEEGVKISSALNFAALEAQFGHSVRALTLAAVKVRFFFSGHLCNPLEPQAFFSCDEHNRPVQPYDPGRRGDAELTRWLTVDSPKGHGTLAHIRIDFSLELERIEPLLGQIQPLLPNVAATLENIRLLQEEKRKLQMEAELQTARFVQQTLLPTPESSAADLEINGFYRSASECGGDWWTHFRLRDGRHIVLLGDVTGHGTGSAMVCAVVKGYSDSFVGRESLRLAEILGELNLVVLKMGGVANRAMTMAALAIDPVRREVTFANAGHPHPILLRAGAPGASSYLISSGNILGLAPDSAYGEKTIAFAPGDQILLFSDGLTESTNRAQQMYGDRRLRSFLKSLDPARTAAATAHALIADLTEFVAGETQGDDITAVVVKGIFQD